MGTAEDCKVADEANYHATLGNLFGIIKAKTRPAYGTLMNLPFMAYVTTNYDPLLLNAGVDRGHQFYSYPLLPAQTLKSGSPLYYMHGLARIGGVPTGKNLVLSTSEFQTAYEGMVSSFIRQILTFNNVIFIGCSLSEPEVKESFRRVNTIHRSIQKDSPLKLPERKILLPHKFITDTSGNPKSTVPEIDVETEASEDRQFDELGIEVIRYVSTEQDHPEIESILDALCLSVNPSRQQIPSTGLPEEPQP